MVLGVAAWLTVGAAATAAGVAAIGVLEDGITGSRVHPLDDAEVRRALARVNETSSPPANPAPSPTASAADTRKVLAAKGGTVTARCEGDHAALVTWSPSQGYSASGVQRGPSTSPSLKFESAGHEYVVTVTCANGVPVAHSTADVRGGGGGGDDHGGGRGRGRGRHGGG